MNLLSPKLWFLWLRALLGLSFGTIGAAHRGILGSLGLDILHHAAHLSLRGLDTKFESTISRSLGFMA